MPDSPPASKPKSPEPEPGPQGMDAFPSLDEPAPTSQVRVTGFEGMGEDEDREKFESAFPDLSGEVPQEQVSRSSERSERERLGESEGRRSKRE
jgi:hypothetical protein